MRDVEGREGAGGFSHEDIGIIGSYSSFLALLLIATVLALRDIFDQLIEAHAQGSPGSAAGVILIVSIVLFNLIFLVVPAVPISGSIRRAWRAGRRRLAWVLVYISLVYVIALVYQMLYILIDKLEG